MPLKTPYGTFLTAGFRLQEVTYFVKLKEKRKILNMPIQITAALSFIIALIIVWRANKDVNTDDSLILSILIAGMNMVLTLVIASILCLDVVHTFSTPKTSHNYRKLDTANVTTTLTSGKKTVTLNDQTNPKDLKAFSDGTLSLSDDQGTAKRDIKDIELVNTKNGTTIDHLDYGKETTYRDYFGFHYNEESKNVLRVVFKTDELNKRFGD